VTAALALAGAVEVGLERVAAEAGGGLAGRRVGLVAHAASVTGEGRPAWAVLRAAGAEVRRLFAPEHGLLGRRAAGEPVPDERVDGIPVVSLYGKRTRPEPAALADLEALVVDLQDAGVRFYTYASTLLLCLEAAADAGLELVVLDRPNPLGGERVEGPVADGSVPGTLLDRAPGPLVHGLTLGELARHANAARARPARLTVVPMRGWRRSMTWRDTGREWVAPSPNLRTADAALAYPGVALLEATNVSEGRGTPSPFLLLGAPWIDGGRLAASVSARGFVLEPARFTPRSDATAPDAKHAGVECGGVRVRVTDAGAAQPYRLGLALLAELARTPRFRWLRGGAALDALLGTRRVREALARGDAVGVIVAADAAAHAAFRRARAGALLY
jgi:uncharacterized protein YbbC (DUF1343 family)